jgi:hypothetical protein
MTLFRVDDFPGTKPNEFYRHNLETFKEFHQVMSKYSLSYDLGVIPVYSSDEALRWLGQQPNIRVAMHGVNHDERFPNEFRDHQTEAEVYAILRNEKAILEEETGKPVHAYIPPHNVIDRKTVNALLKAGFTMLHSGPGTDFDVAMYACENGLQTFPSFPPYYGRSDEMMAGGSVNAIISESKARENPYNSHGPLVIGLHWTWEKNIGFEHLDLFLSKICGIM